MLETKVEEVSSNFIAGFMDLSKNKHFWIVIFGIAALATGYYYYTKLFCKKQEPKENKDNKPDIQK